MLQVPIRSENCIKPNKSDVTIELTIDLDEVTSGHCRLTFNILINLFCLLDYHLFVFRTVA
jgi:hypothetical protein